MDGHTVSPILKRTNQISLPVEPVGNGTKLKGDAVVKIQSGEGKTHVVLSSFYEKLLSTSELCS